MLSRSDTDFLWNALDLATKGRGHTRPNPPVGAVIAKDGEIIGRGWHKKCGGDHAEVAAIKDAVKRGMSLSGATIYVTLEPCSVSGRVGACTDAIVLAGIGRVVYALPDPNPKNRGKARRALARHGIECICVARANCDRREWEACGGMKHLQEAARRLIAPFAKHVTTGLPYVSVKMAISLDGKACDDWGDARWVSSARARRATGCFRSEVDAMMVGAETVRRDNPSLLCHKKRNDDLWRAIVSKSGRLPKNAQVFMDEARDRTLVYRDVVEAMRDLGKRGFLHILCEGGLKLATSLAEAGLVDEWIVVLTPKVIGTRRIGKAVTFKTLHVGYDGDNFNEFIGHFGREAQGALS